MAKKQYSVSVDFSAGVNSPQLHEELEADGTVAPIFEGVYKTGDTCEILLTAEPNGAEVIALDACVAAHVPAVVIPDELCGIGTLGVIFFKQVKTESTTATKDSWKAKCTLSLEGLVAGKYRLEWNYLWGYSTTVRSFRARITVDGTEIWLMEQEPNDNSDVMPASGKVYETLTAGNHTIVLEFQTSSNGDTAKMRSAVLEVAQYRE